MYKLGMQPGQSSTTLDQIVGAVQDHGDKNLSKKLSDSLYFIDTKYSKWQSEINDKIEKIKSKLITLNDVVEI